LLVLLHLSLESIVCLVDCCPEVPAGGFRHQVVHPLQVGDHLAGITFPISVEYDPDRLDLVMSSLIESSFNEILICNESLPGFSCHSAR